MNVAQTLCKDNEKSGHDQPEDTETTLRRLFPSTNGTISIGDSTNDGHKRKGKSSKGAALTYQICNKKANDHFISSTGLDITNGTKRLTCQMKKIVLEKELEDTKLTLIL